MYLKCICIYICILPFFEYIYSYIKGKSDNWPNWIKITLCSVGTV